jgi:hypothetical protein
MECEACKQKDALIERLLNRLQGFGDGEVGVSVMDHLADQAEANDKEKLKMEFENMAAAQEVTDRFREVHVTSPYAGCSITEREEDA